MQKTEQLKRTDDGWNQKHHPIIADLLAKKGITAHLEEHKIVGLDWDNKESDKEFLLFLNTALSSIKFDLERPIFEQLEEVHFFEMLDLYLNTTNTTFELLKSKDIPVSAAHEGTTPYEHIVNVVKKLEIIEFVSLFEGEEAQQGFIIQVIVEAICHDWGKFVTAQNDIHQYHAEISAVILEELKSLTEQQIAAIRYHHIFQLVDFGEVDQGDVRQLFSEPASYALLSVLASADVSSVKSYEAFALGGIIDIIRCMNEELMSSAQANNLLMLFQQQIDQFFTYAHQDILDRRRYIEGKVDQIKEFISLFGNKLNADAVALINLIIKTIDDNLNPASV